MNNRKFSQSAFTLIEILIVVIILGILAAIVIPQFTNATTNARNSSVPSSLQTIRAQIEYFKMQHSDTPPQVTTALWSILTTRSNTTDTNVTVGSGTTFGPYLPGVPANPMNGLTTVTSAAASSYGWLYTTGTNGQYSIKALDNAGAILTY